MLFLKNVELKQYFTDAMEINRNMATLLGCVEGAKLLEPSIGTGSLLSMLQGKPSRIDGVDIDPRALSIAKQAFPELSLECHELDFIDTHINGLFSSSNSLSFDYDAVISNPPYGLKFSIEYRKKLKKEFPEFYVRESYGLFFILSIMRLKVGGRYVFLIPDTFLTSKNHTSLRRFICEFANPDTIIRFPSKRFETVNFGYGNLCIIAGRRESISDRSVVDWIESFEKNKNILSYEPNDIERKPGSELVKNIESGWHVGMSDIESRFSGWVKLGDIADCKTGIYTGDNRRFIGFNPAKVKRRLNGHAIEWGADVLMSSISNEEKKEGLKGSQKYVPFIRGGHRHFEEATAWAIRWDADALSYYKENKKARLQNSSYYFRRGLAVPMVSSGRISASLMNDAVFDQGVVGVFPKDPSLIDALLLYFNSSVVSTMRNEILNNGANNSANHLKKLFVPAFSGQDKKDAHNMVSRARHMGRLEKALCDEFMLRFTKTSMK